MSTKKTEARDARLWRLGAMEMMMNDRTRRGADAVPGPSGSGAPIDIIEKDVIQRGEAEVKRGGEPVARPECLCNYIGIAVLTRSSRRWPTAMTVGPDTTWV